MVVLRVEKRAGWGCVPASLAEALCDITKGIMSGVHAVEHTL